MKQLTNLILFLTISFGYAQEVNMIDSLAINNLEEVVITGQYNAQSIKKSVYEVSVISKADIDRQAGNNLADILNQTLNITILPSASTGKSQVRMFGLDGQYVKILVDNIPLVNDEGFGNNTDLTQINLDDVEQIEIVEGAMGVQYGTNAVAGVINIITKKSSRHKWKITPYIQEETIGNEYGWFDKGRHIQSLSISHDLSNKWYANAMFTRNDFAGLWGDKEGQNYAQNDGKRGYEWLPKIQYNGKALLSYNGEHAKLFYKFEYFNEKVSRYDSVVRSNENPSTGTNNPISSDEIFTSNRIMHHLNVNGNFNGGVTYDVSFSFQQQKRNAETYNYRIPTREKFDVQDFEYESRKIYYSKGMFSNFMAANAFDFQLGYELNATNGYASAISGDFGGENIDRYLGAYDVFASAEYIPGNRFSIRPGARVFFSNKFDTQTALELSSKYLFDNNLELRAVVGTAPRMPDFTELYSYFVDTNHDIRGNENLKPEQGTSIFVHAKKPFVFNNGLMLKSKLSLGYINVKDRIELIIVNSSPLAYQYNNIDKYRTWNISFANGFAYQNWSGNLGVSYSGVSKVLDSRDYNDDYLNALQLNANLAYIIPDWGTTFSTYFKHNGPEYQFVQQQDTDGNAVLVRGKQDAYSWWDASVRKSFLEDNKLQITVGARNLLNITRVNTTATEGGAHSGPPSSVLLGYGRSYFIKLLYNLNFN
ncbi:TonB-dependent receptor plug domain-containing protein [Galbibacter pacificus]|uniref:TonB-dependent receptor plug domain-containing protein n=1 Tax=Galbibacter pacificus TaxID=2996052 RepID=A0ABT6FMB9_9FLAO|nr:TonB-dependent receptor plug domain-containing protein [Galbibacter pacificus]MDG3580936.1 TonB-dependent receptor plug domain-containing protein [Galbibacter pacificus]MDG3584414.1 TonB-dependent receptor plug domain-containing protein [Galbibacter pacificus]